MTRNSFLTLDPDRIWDPGDPNWISLTPTQAVDAAEILLPGPKHPFAINQ